MVRAVSKPAAKNDAGAVFVVTAFDDKGAEHNNTPPFLAKGLVNYAAVAGSATITWQTVPGAIRYNIYRSLLLSDGSNLTADMVVGYIGTSRGTKFTDNNIIPDFTKQPPRNNNPFRPGRIRRITITNPGKGFPDDARVTLRDGTGSGFIGYPIVDQGEVQAVIIMNSGQDYVDPKLEILPKGAGSVQPKVEITVSKRTGTHPSTATVFQQRQVYASSAQHPITLWGSQVNRPSNFDTSPNIVESDSWEFRLDTPLLAPIRHLVPAPRGLLAFSAQNIWLLHGRDGGALTAADNQSTVQAHIGSALVEPIRISDSILFCESAGHAIYLMKYDGRSRQFNLTNISIRATLLINSRNPVVRWAHARTPNNLVYMVRKDGTIVVLSLDLTHQQFAFTPYSRRDNLTLAHSGFYRDVAVVRENGLDMVYFVVESFFGTSKTRHRALTIERERIINPLSKLILARPW